MGLKRLLIANGEGGDKDLVLEVVHRSMPLLLIDFIHFLGTERHKATVSFMTLPSIRNHFSLTRFHRLMYPPRIRLQLEHRSHWSRGGIPLAWRHSKSSW